MLMTNHYSVVGGIYFKICCDQSEDQYGISTLISQTSFHRETSGGVMKCQLFSQAVHFNEVTVMRELTIEQS